VSVELGSLVPCSRNQTGLRGLVPGAFAEDGRLFSSEAGGPLQETAYGVVWRRARESALSPEQCTSPLARRPYDLRHAGISLWLNARVAATEVARRAGHGVAVMLQVYANCIDGRTGPITSG
jgi:integrase